MSEHESTGAEKGLAEAERRFGKQNSPQRPPDPTPTDAERGTEKGIAEARRRFGPPPGDAA